LLNIIRPSSKIRELAVFSNRTKKSDRPRYYTRDHQFVVVDCWPTLFVRVDFNMPLAQAFAAVIASMSKLPSCIYRFGVHPAFDRGLACSPRCVILRIVCSCALFKVRGVHDIANAVHSGEGQVFLTVTGAW
jgi:hypothetical protein